MHEKKLDKRGDMLRISRLRKRTVFLILSLSAISCGDIHVNDPIVDVNPEKKEKNNTKQESSSLTKSEPHKSTDIVPPSSQQDLLTVSCSLSSDMAMENWLEWDTSESGPIPGTVCMETKTAIEALEEQKEICTELLGVFSQKSLCDSETKFTRCFYQSLTLYFYGNFGADVCNAFSEEEKVF